MAVFQGQSDCVNHLLSNGFPIDVNAQSSVRARANHSRAINAFVARKLTRTILSGLHLYLHPGRCHRTVVCRFDWQLANRERFAAGQCEH